VPFRWRSCGCEFRRFGRQPQVAEDFLQDCLIGEERQQSACGAAVGADQDLHQENAVQEFSPEVVPPPPAALLRRMWDAAATTVVA